MSTDIHMVVQVRPKARRKDGTDAGYKEGWKSICLGPRSQCYELYAVLGNVRNYKSGFGFNVQNAGCFPVLQEDRGYPTDFEISNFDHHYILYGNVNKPVYVKDGKFTDKQIRLCWDAVEDNIDAYCQVWMPKQVMGWCSLSEVVAFDWEQEVPAFAGEAKTKLKDIIEDRGGKQWFALIEFLKLYCAKEHIHFEDCRFVYSFDS